MTDGLVVGQVDSCDLVGNEEDAVLAVGLSIRTADAVDYLRRIIWGGAPPPGDMAVRSYEHERCLIGRGDGGVGEGDLPQGDAAFFRPGAQGRCFGGSVAEPQEGEPRAEEIEG
jgi:hypothetical protein